MQEASPREQGSCRPLLASNIRGQNPNATLVRSPYTASPSSPAGNTDADNTGTTSGNNAAPPTNELPEHLPVNARRTQASTGEASRNICSSRFRELGLDETSPQGLPGAAPALLLSPPSLAETNGTTAVQESEHQTVSSCYQSALKSAKFALTSPALSHGEKRKLRALCAACQPAQFPLLQYMHGTPEHPDFSGSPQLSAEDERRFTAAVRAATNRLVAILVIIADMRQLDAQWAQHGLSSCPIQGGHGSVYGHLSQRRGAAQELDIRLEAAEETIREQTASMGDILAKYGVKGSDSFDSTCLVTPAVPPSEEQGQPEEKQPAPGFIRRCLRSIKAAMHDPALPPIAQEGSVYDTCVGNSKAPRRERRQS
ncbi:uncharacterized protein PG986_001592 [Apiospora aurea]|uniref:Uncharacterized protein n=1 Tax=Apiospora aurea TaxID=335848 RepID=A0ABR1QX80_9PEZI